MVKIDKLIRSKRKTIALIVERDGTLVVRAPWRASKRQIESFVLEKSRWIETRQEIIRQSAPTAAHKQYTSGESFPYLGNDFILEIVSNAKSPLSLNERFQLKSSEAAHAERLFKAWYKGQALDFINARVRELAARYGFAYNQVKITSARTRWGSCTSHGNLCFTWRLVMAPPVVIDYVLIHELAHLRQKNHSKAFWDLVRSLMPDYPAHRAWLKKNGVRLDL